jgi:hypothetical protein
MGESGMIRAWENQLTHSELFDSSKSLKLTSIDEVEK